MRFAAGLALLLTAVVLVRPAASAQSLPRIEGQVVFLYYENVEKAARFYESTLGLKKTFDEGWVKIYAITETSSVGLVDEKRGYHRTAERKPVMLSIVTQDVDGWYERLKKAGAEIASPLNDSGNAPIRGFIAKDPGGYTVEFFQWRR